MKLFLVLSVFVVAALALVQSAEVEQVDLPTSGTSETIELFTGAGTAEGRRRICTISLCRATCTSLGYRSFRCVGSLCICGNR